jgi:hypothetical protein
MKITNFKFVLAAALSALALLVSGCVSTPTGHSQAGVPGLKSKLTRRYPRSVEQLVAATRVVLARNGKLSLDNIVDNTFQAKVNERDVWISITKVDDKVTELVIMVRHGLGADIDLAAELDKQIALQLTVTP